MSLRFSSACLAIFLLALPGVPAVAQTSAKQDQLQRERERLLRRQQEQQPEVTLGSPPAAADLAPPFPADEQPCKTITAITLEGEAAARFRFALDRVGAIGRCLGSTGINTVLTRAQNAVIARGYATTRIVAMPQDLAGGKLVLTVIPGRVHEIRFAPDADPRGTAANALPISRGDILNLRDIEQGLENFKRVPTAEADIQITPAAEQGAQIGESDLVIQYRQAFPFRLTATLDDGGARTTGKYQGGMTLAYDNWWTVNDLFYVHRNRSVGRYGDQGSSGYTVHYSLPFGYWLVAATMSGSRYHQTVAGAFENFVYSGRSETSELKLSRLLHRDSQRKTTLHLKGLQRTGYSAIDDTEIGPQQRLSTAWEAGLNHREFIGASTLEASLAYRRTLDRQGAPPASEYDLPQIATRYGLVLADASLNMPFAIGPLALRYAPTARAQWNRGALAPQDQFAIGGRYTVRGFDGELSLQAERGWFVRNELSVALAQGGQEFYAAVDTGQVGGPSAGCLTGRRLTGAAMGLRGTLRKLSYEAFVAAPLARPDHFATAPVSWGFSLSLPLF